MDIVKYLTKDEIIELDNKIDERISQFKLLSTPRSQALFNILLHFELLIDELGKDSDLSRRRNLYRKFYNGLNHAVKWIYKFCPQAGQNYDSFLDTNSINEAHKLFDEAIEYSDLFSQMSLIHRGRNKCKLLKPNVFEITSATLKDKDLDAARQLLAQATDPKDFGDTIEITPQTQMYVKNNLYVKQRKNSELTYSVSPNIFSNLVTAIEQRSLLKWSMDSGWDLGGYSFEQLRKLWFTLKGLCILYDIALESVKNEKKRLNLSIRIRSCEEWINELTQTSKLPKQIVRQIVNDLTYDETLYQRGNQKVHVMFQPFFRFQNGKLGLSSRIIRISNIERNAWNLVSFLRPKLHDNLKQLKESFWILDLNKRIETLGLKSFHSFDYKQGNIDLLIIDEKLNFGLNCELKWLTKSDDVAGTDAVDKEIIKGVEQALRASKWIQSNLIPLSQRIGMTINKLNHFDFKPLVICKENLPSGFLGKTDVPVINQQLFNLVLSEPHNKDLPSLWNVANSMSYLPKLGVHYENVSPIIKWGKMQFILKEVASIPLKRWNPDTDISFEN